MNEELQQALVEFIGSFTATLGQTKGFVLEQAPEVIQQLLVWRGVLSLACFVAGLVFLISAPLLFGAAVRIKDAKAAEAKEAYAKGEAWTRFGGRPEISTTSWEYDSAVGYGGAIPSVLVLVSILSCILGVCLLSLEWLQIWLAPKVYLIEYAAGLAK